MKNLVHHYRLIRSNFIKNLLNLCFISPLLYVGIVVKPHVLEHILWIIMSLVIAILMLIKVYKTIGLD